LNLSRITINFSTRILCLGLLLSLPSIILAETSYEDRILSSLQNIQGADIDSSLESLNQIIEQYPNSKVSHLVLADILSMRAGSSSLIKDYDSDNRQLNGLRDELRYRWQHKMLDSPAHSGLLPSNLVQTSDNQEHIIVVDASTARLFIYQNQLGNLTLVDDFYMTVGKSGMGKNHEGDLRTPIGVYHVTSYLPGETLPDRYGPGAFPINYPNDFDKRHKRTGYGIWIHGTESDNYNRVPLASDGCVSLSNDAFLEISRYIKTDGTTPVIISENFTWSDPQQVEKQQSSFNAMLNQWKKDWENRDHENYIAHYSDTDFKSGKFDYNSWSKHKQATNKSKSYIQVRIENLSIFSYPGEENLVMMRFDQNYRSNNYNSQSRKTLFWKLDKNSNWKIIFEG
jgi:murein L,D-transpeptidase YafK